MSEEADPRHARAIVAWGAWTEASHEAQRPPDRPADEEPWRTWVFLGGRGAGKTRAGAEWVCDIAARLGPGGRIALVGATMHDVRAVMIEGPSGIMTLPHQTPPELEVSRRRLTFPGGATAMMLSAAEPQRFRGPQFHAAWGDEFCAWKNPEEALALLRMGLRLGMVSGANARPAEPRCSRADGDGEAAWVPKLLLTTTPRPLAVLRRVLAETDCVSTHASTGANARNLAGGFLEAMREQYGGTRRAAQELDGLLLEAEGALFTLADLARARERGRARNLEGPWDDWERAVVAVDPPAGTLSGQGGDACGIVVAAKAAGAAWVLEDLSVSGMTPAGWAARVAKAAEDWAQALDCGVQVLAEGNQGGAMVEAVLRGAGVVAPVRRVHARLGKRARAEPVAALYEQGKVGHLGDLSALEAELMGLGEPGGASPDRADALVWAITALMIDPRGAQPRVRTL